MKNISETFSQLQQQIDICCQRHSRQARQVRLIAVSKTRAIADIEQVIAAGQRHFAENQVQEAIDKIEALRRYPLTWHFIGQIQSNKTPSIARYFQWVHSIDRLKIAQRLQQQRSVHLPPLNICLQVNLDNEPQKAGVAPEQVLPLAKQLLDLKQLRLRGLMAVPKARTDYQQQRQVFAKLRQLFDDLRQQGIAVDTLSMGMTNDWSAAIAEGATMLRIGSAIFGERQ